VNRVGQLTTGTARNQARSEWTPPEYRERAISTTTKFLFYCLVVYIVLPIAQVPLIDTSFSAFIALFLTFGVFFGSEISFFRDYGKWIALGLAIWLGIFFSLAVNSFTWGSGRIDLYNWKFIIRFAYWITVFLMTVCVGSTPGVLPRLAKILVVMITLVGLARWGETIVFGAGMGKKAKLLLMTQNSYALGFSTFAPFLLVPLFSRQGKRWLAGLVAITVWGAVAINGSRGAWVGVMFGIASFLFLCIRVRPSQIMGIFLVILLSLIGFMGLLSLMPDKFMGYAHTRVTNMSDLDKDKSVSTRKLMIQKGWKMFRESPLVGAGVGSFTKAFIKLERGDRSETSQRMFNRRSSHNSYIEWLGETGLVGTIPFVLLLLVLGFQGYKSAVYLGRQGDLWALGIYASFLAMSLHLIVVSSLKDTAAWVVYGLVAAMIVAAKDRMRAENSPPKFPQRGVPK
jgi:O-antigen ligase